MTQRSELPTLHPVELSWIPADPADWASCPASWSGPTWCELDWACPSFVQLVELMLASSSSLITCPACSFLLIQSFQVLWSFSWPWLRFPMIHADHSLHHALFTTIPMIWTKAVGMSNRLIRPVLSRTAAGSSSSGSRRVRPARAAVLKMADPTRTAKHVGLCGSAHGT